MKFKHIVLTLAALPVLAIAFIAIISIFPATMYVVSKGGTAVTDHITAYQK